MSDHDPPRVEGVDGVHLEGAPIVPADQTRLHGVLPPMEQMALELVASVHSHAAAGAHIGRSAKTVQRLLKRPEARAFVRSAQAEPVQSAPRSCPADSESH